MGDFSLQNVERKKQDFGNDDDDKPSAAEFAKALLLGNVGLFGEADSDKDSDDMDIPKSPGHAQDGGRGRTGQTNDELGKNSRPNSRMDIVSFKPQEEWWTSAEVALEMLEKERKSLTRSMATKETLPQRIGAGLVSTNRYITTKIKELVKGADAEKKQQFRDGIEEISHVLPQDTQREFHRRTCLAAKDGNLEELQSLLKFQVDLDRTDAFGTPLHYACYNSKLEAAQMILDHGAYAGVPNMRDETPLHIAAQNASGECIDILIHYGARVNAVTAAGWSAIHFAAKEGHTKLVQKLILGGADVDLGNKVGWTPLHIAAMGMHHQTMDMLLNQGMADPNSRCTHTSHLGNPGDEEYEIFRSVAGDTPAHFAARKGHYMCLKTLLHYGVDLGGVNEMGETLAHCAVESGEIRILELLLEHGAQFLAVDDKKGNDSVDFCDKVILKYMGPQHEEIRNKLIKIKDVLVKMTQKRKHQLHRELIEKARENLGGRKKKTRDDSVPQQSEMEKEIDDLEIDEKTLEEKLTAMRLELEASRAAHKQLEMQTKGKTHELNETLLEMSRQLAETQYELGRERKVRQQLEEGILTTLRSHVHADKDSKGGSGQDPEEEFDRELEAGDGSGKPLYPDDDNRGAGRDDPYSQPPDVLRIQSTAYSSRGVTADSRVSGFGDERDGFEQDDDDDDDGGQARRRRSQPGYSGTSAGEDDWKEEEEYQYEEEQEEEEEQERGQGHLSGYSREESRASGYSREESRAYESEDAA